MQFKGDLQMENKVIVALDGMELEDAYVLINILKGTRGLWGFKVNSLLLQEGNRVIKYIKEQGLNVFADPKLFDIPSTIINSLNVLSKADIITVHLRALFQAPIEHLSKLAGVTVLTSENGLNAKEEIFDLIRTNMFHLKYPYVVCPPNLLPLIHRHFKSDRKLLPKFICPGIRTIGSDCHDQNAHSLSTPRFAIDHGASLIVVGRPITQAKNPLDILNLIQAEIDEFENLWVPKENQLNQS